MNSSDWDSEMAAFPSMPSDDRVQWLSKLMCALTVFARSTYTVGGEGVDDPSKLRRFNELFHRVASQLRDTAVRKNGRPDDVFVKGLTESMRELGIQPSSLLGYLRKE